MRLRRIGFGGGWLKRSSTATAAAWGLLLALASPAWGAGTVNPKNGNFAISYADEPALDHDRVYNSKSTQRGWFGYGWGTRFESRLLILDGESAAMQLNGSGGLQTFGRADAGHRITGAVIERIVSRVRQVERLDDYEVEDLRRKLVDPHEQFAVLRRHGLQQELASGIVLHTDGCEGAFLKRQGEGYLLRRCNDELHTYDRMGRLQAVEPKSGPRIELRYGDGPWPTSIESPGGARAELSWNLTGQIEAMRTVLPDGTVRTHRYGYDGRGDLVLADSGGGNVYRYRYDDRHNLLEIGYIDDSKLQLSYDENSLVRSVTQRDGDRTEYGYVDGDGLNWTQIRLHAQKAGGPEQWFGYTPAGQLVARVFADGRQIRMTLDPLSGKVASVLRGEGLRRYRYDAQSRLVGVEDGVSGRQVWIRYLRDDLIGEFRVWDNGRMQMTSLHIEYGPNGKPVRIETPALGHVDVSYAADGEISSVQSPQGAATALQITQAFQSLLEVVRIPEL